MTADTATTKPAKVGRPLKGDAPMSSAERMRRTRELRKAAGSKAFQMLVNGLHLQYLELTATRMNASPSEALRWILEPALDRYVGLMRRVERMSENGATQEEVAEFTKKHWMPELPPMPEKNGQ